MVQHIGSDEINSVVVDVGSYWSKAGFAGVECPCVYTRSFVNSANGNIGEESFGFSQSNVDLNYEIERILQGILKQKMNIDGSEYPLLLCDNFNDKDEREKVAEWAFEELKVPAFYMAKGPVLSSFASGKSTALVLDLGHSKSTVSPVVEGYVVKKGIVSTDVGSGKWLNEQCKEMLKREAGMEEIIPRNLVLSKKQVNLRHSADFVKTSGLLSDTIIQYGIETLMDEFKELVPQVNADLGTNPALGFFDETDLSLKPPQYFEFPNGYNHNFGLERFRLGEAIFNPEKYSYSTNSSSEISITEAISKALLSVDAESRVGLASNILLVGGGSCLKGLSERISLELGRHPISNSFKVKVSAPQLNIERKFSSWIGGSVLGSLSRFHQLWISASEYAENGISILDKKSPF